LAQVIAFCIPIDGACFCRIGQCKLKSIDNPDYRFLIIKINLGKKVRINANQSPIYY
jgi:hypothetical protein